MKIETQEQLKEAVDRWRKMFVGLQIITGLFLLITLVTQSNFILALTVISAIAASIVYNMPNQATTTFLATEIYRNQLHSARFAGEMMKKANDMSGGELIK